MSIHKLSFLKNSKYKLSISFLIYFLPACNNSNSIKYDEKKILNSVATLNYKVISFYPHDTTAFTEGLVFHKNQLFESTGSPDDLPQTKSIAGPINLRTGKIIKKIELDRYKYFGEGIVFLRDELIQLTYKNKIGFIYNAKTFKKIGQFYYQNKEGWGLTTDGTNLIMSDGTNRIRYFDPIFFNTVKILNVTENNIPEVNLNELEYIDKFIYANVFTTNFIVKIDPETGNIVGKVDLSVLAKDSKTINPNSLEMNGIAYDSTTEKIFITGKFWPRIYVIQFL